MGPDLEAAKARLRKEIKERLDNVSEQARKEDSARACALLAKQGVWQRASSVLLYAPLTSELNVWPMLEVALGSGKLVALPRYDSLEHCYRACHVKDLSKDLAEGRYGIREPGHHCASVPLNRLDFILVPGIAYDMQGRRLGRGKGFYDRLLAAVRGTACGAAFDQQIVRVVPVGTHDSDVNCILTPTRWIEL